MHYQMDLSNIAKKHIFSLGGKFSGKNPDGETIGFTNYYMTKNGLPFFGISGEIHYSRVAEEEWEDTIVKAKMGGLNIIASYVFWNVHEEVEGVFRWDGVRNLRKFLKLCKKHDVQVIIRIGPFGHGEMRNGAFPDWIYGKPFEVRSCDPAFYVYVRRYFAAIHEQVKGLYYSEGGPVVATQLDNEYMHSAAPWEMTTGISDEWVPGGNGGDQYMLDLKSIMQEVGIVTPFYTCTAWGGARTPIEEALPLWGGYSYWPWMFYDEKYVHPATPEYIYRDCHNNEKPVTYNFEPRYQPEERPYACCEMMGGMQNYYNYRFILDYNCVDAMANVKLGSGCNLLGYYMYRGGSNPTGERTPYLNEHGIPKISYDYQAAISQYGQLRPSWYKLKTLHYFCQSYAEQLCGTKTVLPESAETMEPTDTEHLRFSVRVKADSGFLFLNNYQDHFQLPARKNDSVTLKLPSGEITIPNIGLESGISAILPFHQELGSAHLLYATVQPITHTGNTWFFFTPDGMDGRFVFDGATVQQIHGCSTDIAGNEIICRPEPGKAFELLTAKGERLILVALSQDDSSKFYGG